MGRSLDFPSLAVGSLHAKQDLARGFLLRVEPMSRKTFKRMNAIVQRCIALLRKSCIHSVLSGILTINDAGNLPYATLQSQLEVAVPSLHTVAAREMGRRVLKQAQASQHGKGDSSWRISSNRNMLSKETNLQGTEPQFKQKYLSPNPGVAAYHLALRRWI